MKYFLEVLRAGNFIDEFKKRTGGGVETQNYSYSSNVLSLAKFPKSLQNPSHWRQAVAWSPVPWRSWTTDGLHIFYWNTLKTSLWGTLPELLYFRKTQFSSTLAKTQIQSLPQLWTRKHRRKGGSWREGASPFTEHAEAEKSRSQAWELSRL